MNSSERKDRIRILFIIDKWNAGGRQRVLQQLINGLDLQRFEPVLLVLAEPNASFPLPQGRAHILPSMRYRSYISGIARILRAERPDIVNSHLGLVMIPLLTLALFISRIHPTEVYTIQSIFDLDSYRRSTFPRMNKYLISKSLGGASAVTVASEGMIEPLSFEFGASRSRMHMLPHPAYEAGHPSARDFGSSGTVSMISIGRFAFPKDFSTILKAFKKAREVSAVRLSLSLIGSGIDDDALRAEARDLGLEESIFKGAITVDKTIFETTDIFIFSSRSEGMPVALIEAMAAGVPTIATDCDFGPRELIKNGENGFLVPVGDMDAMADAIIKISENPEMMRSFSNKAPGSVKRYELKAAAGEWERLFREVL